MSWDDDDDWDDDDACPCDACVYNEGDYCHWGHDDRFNDCEVCTDFDDGELDEDDDDDYEDEDERDMREGEDDLLDYYNNH